MSSRLTLRATIWATCCASLGDSRCWYQRGFALAGTTITALLRVPRATQGDAGVVEQHVQPSIALDHLVDK